MSLMENFQISTIHTYLPLEKNLKTQIAKLSNYAVKKGSTPFYRLSKMRNSQAEHKTNGSSGPIQIPSFMLNALFSTLWKYIEFFPLFLFHIKT